MKSKRWIRVVQRSRPSRQALEFYKLTLPPELAASHVAAGRTDAVITELPGGDGFTAVFATPEQVAEMRAGK